MTIRKTGRLLLVLIIAIGMMGASVSTVSAAAKTPSKVTGLKVTKATDTVITVEWKKASNAKKYEVLYKASIAKSWKSVKTTAKKATIKKLKQNTKYQFKVRGLNGTKKGKYSSTRSQQTYRTPTKVNGKSIYATSRSKNEIKLAWSAAKNATTYEVMTAKLNSDGYDLQNSDYEEVEPNKYVSKTEFTSRIQMRPNTWYMFKVRTVNANTGKFPALKSVWSDPFYACTTTGTRLITGAKDEAVIGYNMTGTFIIGVDDPLVPETIYEIPDPTENWYDCDYMDVEGITFPADYDQEEDYDNAVTTENLAGKTFAVGDSFEEYIIQRIIVGPKISEAGTQAGNEVTFVLSDSYKPSFFW